MRSGSGTIRSSRTWIWSWRAYRVLRSGDWRIHVCVISSFSPVYDSSPRKIGYVALISCFSVNEVSGLLCPGLLCLHLQIYKHYCLLTVERFETCYYCSPMKVWQQWGENFVIFGGIFSISESTRDANVIQRKFFRNKFLNPMLRLFWVFIRYFHQTSYTYIFRSSTILWYTNAIKNIIYLNLRIIAICFSTEQFHSIVLNLIN